MIDQSAYAQIARSAVDRLLTAECDIVYYGDASPRDILDPKIEREPGLAARVWELADIRPEDVFVIISNSGGNAAIVEMARLAVRHGHQVVAITSRAHTAGLVVDERLAAASSPPARRLPSSGRPTPRTHTTPGCWKGTARVCASATPRLARAGTAGAAGPPGCP
ncbi:SIS domain-containing protein [Nonomuraea sp. NBC_00507]|uniref:SIS domain-containing protein n=1 Tax=Nonomuraea sp. NBC_00507 TaxID=2976002 RepID=UPI002E19C4C9